MFGRSMFGAMAKKGLLAVTPMKKRNGFFGSLNHSTKGGRMAPSLNYLPTG